MFFVGALVGICVVGVLPIFYLTVKTIELFENPLKAVIATLFLSCVYMGVIMGIIIFVAENNKNLWN